LFLLLSNCIKQNTRNIVERKEANVYEPVIQNSENTQSLGIYSGSEDVYAPDGKMIRVYNGKKEETSWGPIYSPIIYLYDGKNRILAIYNTLDLVSESFWPGSIRIIYNSERNSFDMIFSLDEYGNYGTANIDLNTNKLVHELVTIPNAERNEQILQRQGIPDDYIEGTNLKNNVIEK
jgi:hypothetical protein